jgi:trans-aconitate methyltransferase
VFEMNALVGIARRLGPLGRRWGWDHVFRHGASFAGARRPDFSAWARELVTGRHVLELACGDGSLAVEIAAAAVSYVGFDVSREAVIRAANRVPGAAFMVGDMETATPGQSVEIIIIEEALYYLGSAARARLLRRCLERAPVLVTVHDAIKHAPTIASCLAVARTVERRCWGTRVGLLLEGLKP